MGGICDTAVAAGTFKTLVFATRAAGLVDTLNTKGPYTVFAPTDDAFAKLPAGTIESLLKDIPKLTANLTYHVVEGAVPASEVVQHKNLTTLQGQDLKVDAVSWHLHKSVKINDANIITADVKADNGVIHIIDKVLLPKQNRRQYATSIFF
jgi:uncharacterized surface protein with fasciclin (FAS1) repeats